MSFRKALRLAIALAALVAIGWLIYRLGPMRVARVAREADPLLLAWSLVPLLGRFAVWGWKWQRILRREIEVPFWPVLEIQLAGSFVNLTTPTAKLAGGFLRAMVIARRYGGGWARAYGRAFADQCTTVLGTLALYAVTAPVAYVTLQGLAWRGWALALGLAIGAGLLGLVLLRPWLFSWLARPAVAGWLRRRIPARYRREQPDDGWIGDVLYPLLGEGSAWRTLVPDILWGAVAALLVCWANAAVLQALGAEAPFGTVCAVVILSYFAGILLSAWGGVGVTEASLAGLYIQVGISPETAAAAALLHRATFYLLVLLLGGAAFWRVGGELSRSGRSSETETQPESEAEAEAVDRRGGAGS